MIRQHPFFRAQLLRSLLPGMLPAVIDRIGDRGQAMGTPLLEAREVTMRYRIGGADVLALQRVSLHVDEGEFVALVGPSGSGKTTLLSIFAGLETPTAGTVALRGDTQARLLGRAGYMPQRDLLLSWRTALGNA